MVIQKVNFIETTNNKSTHATFLKLTLLFFAVVGTTIAVMSSPHTPSSAPPIESPGLSPITPGNHAMIPILENNHGKRFGLLFVADFIPFFLLFDCTMYLTLCIQVLLLFKLIDQRIGSTLRRLFLTFWLTT